MISVDAVIDIRQLAVQYQGRRVLDSLSFSVLSGQIFGFIGPNGAGKSTTIKAVLGLVPYQGGSIKLHGLPPSDPESRRRVGFLPEEARYYGYLTPVEILTFYGRVFGVPRNLLKARIEKLLHLTGLESDARRFVGKFSKGMTQKVSLAQALINEPDTLILDEPTSGLDPLARLDLRSILEDLKKQGKTIFFSSHELSEVELLCDSIAMVKSGRLVKSGPVRDVLGSAQEKNLERFFLETIRSAS